MEAAKKQFTEQGWTKGKKELFNEGRKQGFIEVLRYLHPDDDDIWDRYTYDVGQVQNFVELEINALKTRLDKARLIYKQNMRIISQMSQLSIE